MHVDNCLTCGLMSDPRVVLAMKDDYDQDKFCSVRCWETFRKWADSGSALSLFGFHLRMKYPEVA